MLIQLTECYDIGTPYIWSKSQRRKWQIHNELENISDRGICEMLAKQVSYNLGNKNDDYKPGE